MTKIDSRMVFFLSCCFLVAGSVYEPRILGDENSFLEQFVNHEFLNFMGVIVTITLASTANIHMELRRKEAKAKKDFLSGTRNAVKKSAYSLVWALFLSLILVVGKPLLPDTHTWMAIANSIALSIILWGILVIWDITKLSFKL
ncbi:hypothetical protein [Shimia sagamensis]|uniref:Uncharacterized protein n=1 Tax=Shimia sagamensis TaxID=1566352 RepID=A0ABY1PK80_9RHOB|nr:hypothetical protein [Shimia sagamensis]SMP36040.1 hypothetical protein SAMN06265373_11335 [Shimia sagamensis]